jgi:aerobic-type carbon monoxide dehydrogenase small subunit (CoxS/CutS family)
VTQITLTVNDLALMASTLTAIKANRILSARQQASQDHQGLQFGFSTPAKVMSAAVLLQTNLGPSHADVRTYLESTLCGCAVYHNIVMANMAANGQDVDAVAAA